jgi:hypothetical protein
MKRCPGCATVKERTDFYRSKQTKDGLQGWCKNCNKEAQRRHKLRDPESWRAERRESGRKVRQNLRWEVLESLGGACLHCGLTDLRVLQIDHVFDDGYKHRKRGSGSYHTYLRGIADEVYAGSDRYQALCANCHVLKTWHRDGGVAWQQTS